MRNETLKAIEAKYGIENIKKNMYSGIICDVALVPTTVNVGGITWLISRLVSIGLHTLEGAEVGVFNSILRYFASSGMPLFISCL